MDLLNLQRHYGRLSDDELLRIWADKDGLSEGAISALSEELRKRGLLADLDSQVRVRELREELEDNRRRYERGQRRIIRRILVFAIAPVIVAVVVFVLWLVGAIR